MEWLFWVLMIPEGIDLIRRFADSCLVAHTSAELVIPVQFPFKPAVKLVCEIESIKT